MYDCEKEGCNRFSDVDVYYENGSVKSMCAEHAWDEKNTIQLVPQHGSDNINREKK